MALTGPSDGPALGPPAGLVELLASLGTSMAASARSLGGRLDLEPIDLLSERAAIAGLRRAGSVSCGGASHLIRALDEWVCVSLARDDDIELLDAWLESTCGGTDPSSFIEAAASTITSGRLVERAAMLGLPVSALSERSRTDSGLTATPSVDKRSIPGPASAVTRLSEVTVVDLSSLWAGPLCGSLLSDAGASVIKVESSQRVDGARRGPRAFFDLMNAGKESVELDLSDRVGVQQLSMLLATADVVIEASRPRALEQMGIDAVELIARGGPAVWVSITGHGRNGEHRNRVAFGDDAAVAGGLVAWHGGDPMFCSDAIADPLSGIVAAEATLAALNSGGRWLLDVPMSRVAASFAGPTKPVAGSVVATEPRCQRTRGRAADLGADTRQVLDRLSLDRTGS